ncbi:MAG TPA: ATP-binding protein [Bryobacteraceae bacterium]|nr:ATP-binding protein [Bryobacteraceae bacterium]
MLSFLLRGSSTAVLLRAGAMIALIAFLDWRIEGNIPLGFLYLFPMLLVGSAVSRWPIFAVAALCTFLTESFDTFKWSAETGIPRDILIFAAFAGMGLFVLEATRSRHAALLHVNQIESEVQARRDAEEQLKILVESSPAAIFTANSEGRILLANDAAHRLLGLEPGALPGKSIGTYLPSLVTVPALDQQRQSFRTVMQCRGQREDGDVFMADVWFSTYRTSAGSRLAAMVVDTSEDLRSREELSFHHLLAASRILVGAVSHEIRNVCGAIAVVHENLSRNGALAQNKDFEALGTLISALEKIAAMDLRQTANQAAGVDLRSVIEELRIVVEPSLREAGIEMRWSVEAGLPPVWADRQSLMQVFLNLIKNSERAMLKQPRRVLNISARREKQRVVVRFQDSGSGVTNPDRLFRPFQQGAQATGLGLYLSRAFMRSFRGDLRYEPEPRGSSFIVELSSSNHVAGDPDSISGRPQLVPGEPQPVAPGRT